jgi:hypothetical protein
MYIPCNCIIVLLFLSKDHVWSSSGIVEVKLRSTYIHSSVKDTRIRYVPEYNGPEI